jgi:hypothetical protein
VDDTRQGLKLRQGKGQKWLNIQYQVAAGTRAAWGKENDEKRLEKRKNAIVKQ